MSFDICVECYAGHRGEEEPRAFTMGDTRFAPLEVVDRWLHPEHRYFKVRVPDGRLFVLRLDERSGRWELAALAAGS